MAAHCPICGVELKTGETLEVMTKEYAERAAKILGYKSPLKQHRCDEKRLKAIDRARERDDVREQSPPEYKRLEDGFDMMDNEYGN